MASFSDLLPVDPVGSSYFANLTTTLYFSVNLVRYLLYAVLIVWFGYSLFFTIYNLWFASPGEETHRRFLDGLQRSVVLGVGLILLYSSQFLLVYILRLLGVPDAENIFLNLPF